MEREGGEAKTMHRGPAGCSVLGGNYQTARVAKKIEWKKGERTKTSSIRVQRVEQEEEGYGGRREGKINLQPRDSETHTHGKVVTQSHNLCGSLHIQVLI